MAPRIFLALSALVWLPYGVYCLLRPESLAEAAGVQATTATGTVELRAMYGGLQIALGALALIAAVRTDLVRTALAALAFLCGGLGVTRGVATLAAGELSGYTAFALAFEWGSAAIALWLLSRPAPDRAS